MLLLGPPGCGKTLLARAVAGEANVPFFFMSGSEFVEMFVGLGAARVELFQQAKEKAPALVFLDEIDTIGKGRAGAMGAGFGAHDEREQTLNQLLVEMDGFDSSKGVIIMAATNRPDVLDQALVRPVRPAGRRRSPGPEGPRGHPEGPRPRRRARPVVDLRVLAARTPGFTGADLANIVNEAALLAARKEKDAVTMIELEEAIDRGVAGLERKSRVMSEKEREIVAKHEMGHALVALTAPPRTPSTASRSSRVGGRARDDDAAAARGPVPAHRAELHDRLAVLLGGRTAEEICFDQISTGAQNDLQRATEIARAMVTEYGMSDEIGPLSFGQDGMSAAMWYPGARPEISEALSERIDAEVARLVNKAHARATTVLNEHRAFLDTMAELLMVTEVIDGKDLLEYFEGTKPVPDVDALRRERGNGAQASEQRDGPDVVVRRASRRAAAQGPLARQPRSPDPTARRAGPCGRGSARGTCSSCASRADRARPGPCAVPHPVLVPGDRDVDDDRAQPAFADAERALDVRGAVPREPLVEQPDIADHVATEGHQVALDRVDLGPGRLLETPQVVGHDAERAADADARIGESFLERAEHVAGRLDRAVHHEHDPAERALQPRVPRRAPPRPVSSIRTSTSSP